MFNRSLIYILSVVLLVACSAQPQPTVQATNSPTLTSSPIPSPTSTLTPTITPTPTPLPMAGPVTENVMTRLGKGWINNLTFSPNGKILSVATSIGVYLYQVETMELLYFLSSNAFVNDTIFIDDKTLVIGESDGSTAVWSIESTPKMLATLQRTDPVVALGISEDNTILITEFGFSGTSGVVNVIKWDRANPETVKAVSSEHGYQAEYSSVKNILVLETNTGKIILIDTKKMRATATICTNCVAFDLSQNGEILAVVKGWDDKAQIAFLDMTSQKEIAKFKNPEPRTSSLLFSPNGKLLVSTSFTGLNLWNVETTELINTFDGASSVSFSPDSMLLASASQDGNLTLRELSSGKIRFMVEGFTPISQAVFQNGYVASTIGHWDIGSGAGRLPDYFYAYRYTIFLRDNSTGEIARTLSLSDQNPEIHLTRSFENTSFIFSPNGKLIASAGSIVKNNKEEDAIIVLNASTGEQLLVLKGSDPIAFSPNGSMLATGTTGNQLVFWDSQSGEALPVSLGLVPENFGYPFKKSLVFSPDGSMIAILSDKIILRDVSTGEQLNVFDSGFDPMLAFIGFEYRGSGVIGEFSPNGQILATSSLLATSEKQLDPKPKGIVILWDIASGEKIAILDGHSSPTLGEYSNPITALAFSPDGNYLATSAEDHTIIIWDAKSGSQLKTLQGHSGAINSLAFSSDGKLLYSGSLDGTVIIWSLEQLLP